MRIETPTPPATADPPLQPRFARRHHREGSDERGEARSALVPVCFSRRPSVLNRHVRAGTQIGRETKGTALRLGIYCHGTGPLPHRHPRRGESDSPCREVTALNRASPARPPAPPRLRRCWRATPICPSRRWSPNAARPAPAQPACAAATCFGPSPARRSGSASQGLAPLDRPADREREDRAVKAVAVLGEQDVAVVALRRRRKGSGEARWFREIVDAAPSSARNQVYAPRTRPRLAGRVRERSVVGRSADGELEEATAIGHWVAASWRS